MVYARLKPNRKAHTYSGDTGHPKLKLFHACFYLKDYFPLIFMCLFLCCTIKGYWNKKRTVCPEISGLR